MEHWVALETKIGGGLSWFESTNSLSDVPPQCQNNYLSARTLNDQLLWHKA